jgi:hypothetical protein
MASTSTRGAALALLVAASSLATVGSAASLKNKPPEGVTLAGTHWTVDPYRSDDPKVAIDRAQREADETSSSRSAGGMRRGGDVFGDPWGGDRDGGTWGGGNPQPGGSGGDWRRNRGGNSTTIDPTGGSQSATVKFGSTVNNPFLLQLLQNPDRLRFSQGNENLTVSEDNMDTNCTPGEKIPLADSYGDGELSCGWDSRTLVVETRRGKLFKRVDRYELSKDGKTLRYTTSASGQRMPSLKISRTYTVAPAPSTG